MPVNLPNFALHQEKHQLVSIGYRGKLGWVEPRLEAYYGRKDGLIESQNAGLGAGSVASRFQNAGNIDYLGVSAWIGLKPTKDLQIFAHYTYTQYRALTDIILTSTAVVKRGTPFNDSPRHVAGLGARWSYQRFSASLQAYFQSSALFDYDTSTSDSIPPADASLVVNPMLGFWIDQARRWQLIVSGTNVADVRVGSGVKRDLSSFSVQRIGPRAWLELRFKLD